MSVVRVTRVVYGVSVLVAALAATFAAASCFSETAPFSVGGAGTDDGSASDGGDATTGDGATKARWCSTQRKDALCEDFDEPPLNPALILQASGAGAFARVMPYDAAPSPPNIAALHGETPVFQSQATFSLPTHASTSGVTIACKIYLHGWDAGGYATTVAALTVHSGSASRLYALSIDGSGKTVLVASNPADDAGVPITRTLSQGIGSDRFVDLSMGVAHVGPGQLSVQVVVDGTGAATIANVAGDLGDTVSAGCGMAKTNTQAAVGTVQDAIVDDLLLFAD